MGSGMKIERDARSHKCDRCGEQAVDRMRGEWLCRECLCPAMRPDERAELLQALSCGDGTLAREIGGYDLKDGMQDLGRALTRAMERHGIAGGWWI